MIARQIQKAKKACVVVVLTCWARSLVQFARHSAHETRAAREFCVGREEPRWAREFRLFGQHERWRAGCSHHYSAGSFGMEKCWRRSSQRLVRLISFCHHVWHFDSILTILILNPHYSHMTGQFGKNTSKCLCSRDLNLHDMSTMLLRVWIGCLVTEVIRFSLSDQERGSRGRRVGGSERPTDVQLLGTLWLNLDAKRTDWV